MYWSTIIKSLWLCLLSFFNKYFLQKFWQLYIFIIFQCRYVIAIVLLYSIELENTLILPLDWIDGRVSLGSAQKK